MNNKVTQTLNPEMIALIDETIVFLTEEEGEAPSKQDIIEQAACDFLKPDAPQFMVILFCLSFSRSVDRYFGNNPVTDIKQHQK